MVMTATIEAMHAIERYSARDIRRLPLDKERIQLDNNRKRSPYAIFALVFFGAMRQLTRPEQRWYVRGFLPTEAAAGDIDDDGLIQLSDVVSLLSYLFSEGAAPAAPFPDCGADPTTDLDCLNSPCQFQP